MKRILSITAFLLILALALTACGGGSREKEETVYDIFADAVEKTFDSQKGSSASVWEAALEGGSIEEVFTYTDGDLKTISAKSYFGKESSASIFSMALTSGEKFDLSMFADQNKVIITCSALAAAYGCAPDELTKLIAEALVSAESGASNATVSINTDILEKHKDAITELLKKHFPLTLTEAESSMTFALAISNTTLKAFLGDLLTLLENDAEFKQELKDFMIASGEEVDETGVNLYFNEMRDDLADFDEFAFNANVSITATKDRIITGASITAYEGTDTSGTQLARVLISLPANGGFNVEATVQGQTFSAGYTVTEFGTVTKESLSIGAMGVSLTPLTLTYDSATNDFELKAEIPGSFSATVKGNYKATEKEATLSITSIKATIVEDYGDVSEEDILNGALTGNTVIDLPMTVKITAKATDTAPKAPASFTDLTKLGEDDMEDIMAKLQSDPVILALIQALSTLA